jgi:hypothetical protein
MRFAVLMRKQYLDNPWISHKWVPQEVLPDYEQFNNASTNAITGQYLGKDDQGESWLFKGFELTLYLNWISMGTLS